jgi:hypothetical protein
VHSEVNLGKYSDILSGIGHMSDSKLVAFVQKRVNKFAHEMRPLFIEVQERFKRSVQLKHRPFLGKYKNWDVFCAEAFNYSGRHVRRIIAGEAMPTPKEPGAAGAQTKKSKMKEAVVYTDFDYVRKAHDFLKKLLQPLEHDPQRYNKVARAIAEEILGDLREHGKPAAVADLDSEKKEGTTLIWYDPRKGES